METKKLCRQCSKPFEGANQKKYCSLPCEKTFNYAKRTAAHRTVTCPICDKQFISWKKRKYCSDDCTKKFEREYFRKRGVRKYHENKPEAGWYFDKLKCMVCGTVTIRKQGIKFCQQPECFRQYRVIMAEEMNRKKKMFYSMRLVLWDSVHNVQKSVDELFEEDFTPAWMQQQDTDTSLEDLETSVNFNFTQTAKESAKRIAEKYGKKNS